jgi:hypothetical protein
MIMMRIVCTVALAILTCAAASTAPAQDARPWPQCSSAPRCAHGSVATCTAQGTCVIPTRRPHRGCLQYSCVKEPWKAREEELARKEEAKNKGTSVSRPRPSTPSGGAGTVASKPIKRLGKRTTGPAPDLDYGGAPSRSRTLIK